MILIDDRAGSKELILYPPLNSPEVSTLCRLSRDHAKSADVAFLANGPSGPEMLGLELKHIDDLTESLSTGRLQGMDGQMEQMVEDFAPGFRWLLIYGQYRPSPEPVMTQDNKPSYLLQVYRDNSDKVNRRSGYYTKKLGTRTVPYGYVEGFLSGPALPVMGFHSHRVNTIEEAAVWIYILHHTWTKEWDKHKSLRSINKVRQINGFKKGDSESSSDSGSDSDSISVSMVNVSESQDNRMSELFKLRTRFASLFSGMGYERSIAAAKYFEGRSLEDMISATPSEWAEIEIEKKGKRVIRLGFPIAERICKKIKER
jgi:hypothetical protein